MLVLLESAQGGIKGKVFDDYGGPLDGATVEFQKFMGKRKNVNTSNRGEFWKLLLPGSYSIKAFHENKYGKIESDIYNVDVLHNLGEH